ncbi:MAG TPA: hybrid sensor histidine kinase/response regulator [Holophaga sp.]|nr:hybrid sensor histidine kinase/response regulator [Holophaga sp.]
MIAPPRGESEKILLIEDMEILRQTLRSFLGDLGYSVIEAASGEDGLELAQKDHPDLILLDIGLPALDGFQVCERLKAVPNLREIPVLFLSGNLSTADKLRAFQLGAVDYVTKPFQFDEMEARIRTHLTLQRQKRMLQEKQTVLLSALFDAKVLNSKLIDMNERLRDSEAMKSGFIAHMRNEINNPLNAILALAEELLRSVLSPERLRQIAGIIHGEASHLDFQLRNVFCAAELEAGEATPFITNAEIGSILRNVADSLSHVAQMKDIQIRLIDPPDPLVFPTDAAKTHLILENLLANAIEFSPQGKSVELCARIQDDELVLDVKDEGIGISAEDQALIFKRFRQLDTGLTRAHMGPGLGLSVTKALLELMGGEIAVDSEPGQGSRFSCRIPRGQNPETSGMEAFDGNLFLFDDTEEM